MLEHNPSDSIYYEDMIPLRDHLKTLLNYKWIIISITLLAALTAFLVSSFLLSPQYEATAYVTLMEPIVRAELDSSIQVSPALPETGGLVNLAEADSICDQVVGELGLSTYKEDHPLEMEAALQGKSQLRLLVTTDDPVKAAQLANAWADVMVERLNDLYGTGEGSLVVLEIEVNNAKDNWDNAQNALEEYLPESQVEILEVQLSVQKQSLASYLNRIEGNQLLISDGETLKAQLSDLNQDSELTTGTALSIIALQQRSAGEISGAQFQLQGDQILGQGYNVEAGINDLEGLILALSTQNNELNTDLVNVEQRISELSVTLESEKFKVEQLAQERDLARSTYTALANQLEETRITQAQEERTAKVGAEAALPREPKGSNTLMYTGLSGLVAIMIIIGGVLIQAWWIKSDE